MEIKVLLTRKFFEQDLNYITERLHSECKILVPESFSENDLLKFAPEADVFLGPRVDSTLVKSAKKLKFIQVPWTGVDNLDFNEIKSSGVTVCNSHSNANAVAEHAISLLLATAKKIPYHDREMRKGNWNRPKPDKSNVVAPFSKSISNKDVGIIGYGHIGKKIKSFLSGFNCKFHISDVSVVNDNYIDDIHFYPTNKLHTLLKEVEIIFICVPLTEETRLLVNDSFLSKLNKNCILINISRGEVIDEDALYNSLKNHQIAGAGIDTWFKYPSDPNNITYPSEKNEFHFLDNLVLSPHRSAMIEGELPHLDDAIENINRAVKGLEPLNIISIDKKY